VGISDTITLSSRIYLPLMVGGHLSASIRIVDTPLHYAIAESWSWESCHQAHQGDEGGWWPESDKGFLAQVGHGGEEPWAWWDIYRGFAWSPVPEEEGQIVSASLRMPLCYATTWPTQSGEVAFHWGTWPGLSPLDQEGLLAWQMYELEPFAVLGSERLPRIYGRTGGGTCSYEAPIEVEIALPLDRVQPGMALRLLARDGRDTKGCAMEPGRWGVVMIEPAQVYLRLYVRDR
jgi:hypothetical protein